MHRHIARLPPPPARISPDVPRSVSDIIMKLLAKSPDDRFQSAYGLRMDLAECLAQLEAASAIEPFALGRHDYVDALRIPQKGLRPRGGALAVLEGAWRRVSQGANELLLVPGHAGIGKSLLAGEIQKSIAQGKAAHRRWQVRPDQPDRPVRGRGACLPGARPSPLGPSPRRRSRHGRRGSRAPSGMNGQHLVDLIPELELLLGPQPGVEPLGPTETEAQTRLHLAFQKSAAPSPPRSTPSSSSSTTCNGRIRLRSSSWRCSSTASEIKHSS